jgi:hypothetical protein
MNELLMAPAQQRWPRKGFFKRLAWTAAGSCALGGLYAWHFDRRWLRIERRTMPLPGLGEGFDGAKLAHLSDLHCSPIVLERYLRRCVEMVNSLEVDFVAITGDFITGRVPYAKRIGRVLAHLSPRVATLACLGNHDYGILHPRGLGAVRGLADRLSEYLSHADVFVMMNEPRQFRRGDSVLQFVGVEDLWTPRYDPYLAFELADTSLPTIALCHNPDAADELIRHGAHWVLSGHTHGTPINQNAVRNALVPSQCRAYSAGHYRLEGGDLYVNRGLGYGRRVNINARPEITLFTLQSA